MISDSDRDTLWLRLIVSSHDRRNSSFCSPGGLLGSITLGVRYFWLWRPRSFPFGVEVLSFVPLISGGVILHHSKCNYPRKPSLFHVRKTFKKLKNEKKLNLNVKDFLWRFLLLKVFFFNELDCHVIFHYGNSEVGTPTHSDHLTTS